MVVARPKPALLSLAASFGGVSIGDETARIGITFDRNGVLDLARADKHLCQRRITGTIYASPPGEHPDQGHLFETDGATKLQGVMDVKGISVNKKHISAGLTFAISEIDVSVLAKFAKARGMLVIERSDELPEANGKAEENGDDE